MRKSAVRGPVVRVLGIVVLIVVAICACRTAGQVAGAPVRISVALPDSGLSPQRQADGTCRFAGNGILQAGRTGEPDMPVQVVTVLLPPDADLTTVTASIAACEWTGVDGEWDIPPVSSFAAEGGACGPSDTSPSDQVLAGTRDPDTYGEDALYPSQPVRRVDVEVMRGWKVAQVLYAPFAYNPVQKRIYRLSGNSMEVAFERNAAATDPAGVDLAAADTIREQALNYDAVAGEYGDYAAASTGGGRYVIITTSDIKQKSSSLMDFVASKEARGFTVQVVTEDTWGGGTGNAAATNIRSWLKGNYLALGTEYVLLIGDPDPSTGDVPMKMCYPQESDPDYPECPTDFFYAELTSNWNADGDSRYGEFSDDFWGSPPRAAEVAVGRIPYYGDITELDHILAKITAYENAPAGSISWRENVLLPMKASDAETPGYQLGEEIKSDVIVPNGLTYHRVYDSDYGLSPEPETMPCTVTSVTNAWKSADYGAVIWWTHGTSTSASYVMNTTNAAALDDTHPSLVFQCSCLNGTPESSSNLGYSLLLNGCISTVCASRVSWYEIGQTSYGGTATNAGMALEYAERVIGDSMYAGDALIDLRANVMPAYGELWMNYLDFNLYGDPAVGLSTSAPDTAAPTVLTYYAGNLGTTSARLRANLASLGQGGTATVSFQWGTTPGTYDRETTSQLRSSTGTYYQDLTGLKPGTTYYYRAKAAGVGTSYGGGKSFTTLTTPPSVSTSSVTSVTAYTARLNGNLSSLGTAASVGVSFQWGTSPGTYVGETAVAQKSATGAFFSELPGLAPNTTYYCRAKATGDGTAYGTERTFTTPLAPPSVETGAPTSLSGTSAQLNGVLSAMGSASSVTVSFQWGTLPGAYGRETTAEVKPITGTFYFNLTGLTPGTTYYYRAKADGAGSPVYGQEVVFTAPVMPPIVASADVTNLEMTSATLNGDLLSKGTAATVTVSFEWGSAPGVYDQQTAPVQRTTTGSFHYDLDGLAAGTTCYYRARAVGQGDPAYGLEKGFTTATTYPLVATNSATGITTSSAILNGELVSRGVSESVEVSFEWGTTPQTYDHQTQPEVKTSTGSFHFDLTGLDSGATLYYRTMAAGYGEPTFGAEMSLTVFRKPLVTAVSPATGGAGQTLAVTISGSAFTGTTSLSLGPDVVVNSFEVASDNLVNAQVLVLCGSAIGPSDVSVTTDGGTAVLSRGFAVTNSPPSAPRNVAPAGGSGVDSLTPTLGSSPFSHPCPARTHGASQWQATGTAGDYSRPVFDSGVDRVSLTSIPLPADAVEGCASCWWRVRYQDDQGTWSDWSAETSFTPPPFIRVVLCGDAEILVRDSQGLATGSVRGQAQEQIPHSQFDNSTVTVLSPTGTQRYQVTGIADGTYALAVTRLSGDRLLTFRAVLIPVTAGETHEYSVDWNRVSAGGEAAIVRIDSDGDGSPERIAVVAADINGQDFLSAGDGRHSTPIWVWVLAASALALAGAAAAVLLLRIRRQA